MKNVHERYISACQFYFVHLHGCVGGSIMN
jgi:hypothetical protein